jgi:uncharacterized protein with PQ loop repeat
MELAELLANAGLVLAMLLYFSPIPGIYNAWNTGKVDRISHGFLLMSNVCPFFWILMGLKTGD